MYDIAAQVIGIIAMAFNTVSFQQKNRKTVIILQFFGAALFAVNLFMLGAYSGCILNIIAVFRAIVYSDKQKFHSDRIGWLLDFVGLYIASYVLTFTLFGAERSTVNLLVELLPVIGMTSTTIGFRLNDAKAIRIAGLICSPCWLIYDIYFFTIGGICCEIMSLISILIGIYRHDRKKANRSHAFM